MGTGGFASGPLLQVATSKGIPSLIQEQNSIQTENSKGFILKSTLQIIGYHAIRSSLNLDIVINSEWVNRR